MGIFISGGYDAAINELSLNSTNAWILLVGFNITSILSTGKLNNILHSITSNALFISVAESIDIFFPIFHVGWLRALSGVICFNILNLCPLNGPPDAVIIIFFGFLSVWDSIPFTLAGSLSKGINFPECILSFSIINSAPHNIDSLFAKAITFDSSKDLIIGFNDDKPSVATTKISRLGSVAIFVGDFNFEFWIFIFFLFVQ